MIDSYRLVSVEVAREETLRGQPIKLHVIGNSMTPLLHPGDAIIVRPIEAAALRRGDLVVIQRDAELITHRLVVIRGDLFYTKGDNQHYADEPLQARSILGRVISIERPGRTIDLQRLRWSRLNRFAGWLGGVQARGPLWPHGRLGAWTARLIAIPIRTLMWAAILLVSIE